MFLTPRNFCHSLSDTTSAIDIHADPEVVVQNGTTGVLPCRFRSSEVVSSSTTVTWTFQSSQPDNQFSKAPYVVSIRSWEDFPQSQDVFLRLFYLSRHTASLCLLPSVYLSLSLSCLSDTLFDFFLLCYSCRPLAAQNCSLTLIVLLQNLHTLLIVFGSPTHCKVLVQLRF